MKVSIWLNKCNLWKQNWDDSDFEIRSWNSAFYIFFGVEQTFTKFLFKLKPWESPFMLTCQNAGQSQSHIESFCMIHPCLLSMSMYGTWEGRFINKVELKFLDQDKPGSKLSVLTCGHGTKFCSRLHQMKSTISTTTKKIKISAGKMVLFIFGNLTKSQKNEKYH